MDDNFIYYSFYTNVYCELVIMMIVIKKILGPVNEKYMSFPPDLVLGIAAFNHAYHFSS
jgi:hypothetical protein